MEQKIKYTSLWCFMTLLLLLMTIFSLKSYAVPAYDGLFELIQPSGFSFEARQRGDEWHNWVETRDGYGIYQNMLTGNWEYYLPSIDTGFTKKGTNGHSGRIQDSPLRILVGEVDPASLTIPKRLRPPRTPIIKPDSPDLYQDISFPNRSQSGSDRLKNISVSGTIPLLVIGVDYVTTTAKYGTGQVQPLLFGTSDSVSDYYSKTSYSLVTIAPATETSGTANDGFVGWLRLKGNHPNTGSSIDARNQQIAKDAIRAADPYINYSLYDDNGDGIIEPTELSILIIVAGYEAAYSSASPSVWAHQWYMYSVGYPIVDGKTIQQYAQFGEKHGDHLATFGVMAHELGHLMFALPDLYDTDTGNGDSFGIGYFDLMGAGSWGAALGANPGSSPTQLSAWSKEYLSWVEVNTVTSTQTVSFPNTDGNNVSIFRINTSDSNQYFLLENRQFTGYDTGFQRQTGVSGHGGLVIYHVDKLKTGLWPNFNTINADENDKGVDVEEANEGSLGYSLLGTYTYGVATNMFFFSGNSTSFTGSTIPDSKLKNGSYTNISVTDVSSYGDTMTAKITVPLCIADSIAASTSRLKLHKKESGEVTVTVICADGSPVEGELVTAKVKLGKTRILISPQNTVTDANGHAKFMITARRVGRSIAQFKASRLKTYTTIKVIN